MSEEEQKAIEFMNNIEYKQVNSDEFYDNRDILINLIEKQLKEIEELKEYKHDAELTKLACCSAQNCEALNNCIKLGRELQNADNKWEDKIKAKIEELEKEKNIPQEMDFKAFYRIKDLKNIEIEVLQSLLDKE